MQAKLGKYKKSLFFATNKRLVAMAHKVQLKGVRKNRGKHRKKVKQGVSPLPPVNPDKQNT